MKICSITAQDREEFLAMCSDFYSGDAAIHPISRESMLRTFEEALAGNPFLRIVVFRLENDTAGYCQLSVTYSSEAGGLTVLVEEVYVKPDYQGRGIGSSFFALSLINIFPHGGLRRNGPGLRTCPKRCSGCPAAEWFLRTDG